MKKRVISLLLLGILLVALLVSAQEQAQTYSGFDRFIDDVKITFSSGDNKVKLALEIREKEVDSAIGNIKNQETDKAVKNLERAQKKLQLVQEKVSLDTVEEIKISVKEITNKINNENNLPKEFDEYILEEEKTQLAAELTKKIFEWCKELAKEDYTLMLQEEQCNPDTAPPGLQKELKELKNLQEELFVKLMLDIRSCIDDPGTCNCEDVSDTSEKAKCEKMIALAVKCEYKDDQEACSQMKSMRPPAKSFVPDFLMNLFKEKEGMIDYNIEKSDVPLECYNENDKPECEQYRHMKETAKCWDKEGNWLEEECPGPKEKGPTIEESIPECYDENNIFLTEKCGKITMVRNEEGLINYLIGKEIDNIIDEFENKSEQHQIDVEGTLGQTKVQEIKEEIEGLEGQIKERTFAEGTEGTGEPGEDIKTVVVEEGKGGTGDDGLTPEVKTDVAGGNGGDNNVVDEGGMASGTSGTSIDDTIVSDDVDETPPEEPENVIDEGTNVVEEGENQVEAGPNEKDNEDVTPEPNVVDDTVDPGPEGIVGSG